MYSDDDGLSWSIPLVAEYGLKQDGWHSIWPAPGRGTVLSGGRLTVPITISDTEHMHSHFLYSDDHGESWEMSSRIGTDINEPTLVAIDANTLQVNARNYTGMRAIVTSTDRGETWSEIIFHKELVEPGCQGSCIRTRDSNGNDVLVFSNPDHPEKRMNMTVTLSYDNGKTWTDKKVIYGGPSAYSCLTVMPDGEIGLMYENGKESPYEKISFVKFPLEWIHEK